MSTILQQGRFTSTGAAVTLDIRSDVDWMEVINLTQSGTTQATGRGCIFQWQRGFANDVSIMFTKQNAVNALDLETSTGFVLIDSSNQTPEAVRTATAISQANPAVVSVASTAGLSNGDVVRMFDCVGMEQISGLQFRIGGIIANTSFELTNIDTSGFAAAATSASFRRIPFDTQFVPRERNIVRITQAANALVQTSVSHGYSVGEEVRIKVPSDFGMTQISDQVGTVLTVPDQGTFTLDINSLAFTAFSYPATGAVPFDFPTVTPVGENPASGTGTSAANNVSLIGMRLGGGADAPAGSSGDVIYWKAGKSFSVNNA